MWLCPNGLSLGKTHAILKRRFQPTAHHEPSLVLPLLTKALLCPGKGPERQAAQTNEGHPKLALRNRPGRQSSLRRPTPPRTYRLAGGEARGTGANDVGQLCGSGLVLNKLPSPRLKLHSHAEFLLGNGWCIGACPAGPNVGWLRSGSGAWFG